MPRLERAAAFLAEHAYIDALVLGEGELPFRALLSSLLRRRALDGVPSLVFRGTDGTVGGDAATFAAGSLQAAYAKSSATFVAGLPEAAVG